MNKSETEILIIGGGPAGSTAALYLSQLDFDITLIEKKVFPREVLCGEFLSKEVTDILKELNLFNEFITLNPNKLNSFSAVDNSGATLKSKLDFDGYAIKRSIFDSFLLEKAKQNNVNVIQPAEVISHIQTEAGFISIVETGFGEILEIESRLVIGAYGKQNVLDKKLDRKFVNNRSDLNGVKFHLPINLLKDHFKNEINIFIDDGIYCGINQVSNSEITICFLENRKKTKIPSRERLIELINSSKYLKNIFTDDAISFLKSANVYGTGNIYFGKKDLVENGMIMIGDSARVIAPLAGDGIGMAMESAKLLCEIIKKHSNNLNISGIQTDYQKKYNQIFLKRLTAAKIIQKILLNKFLQINGFRLVNHFPFLLPYLIKYTRNSQTG